MVKKFYVWLVSLSLCVILAACGSSDEAVDNETDLLTPEVDAEEEVVSSGEPAEIELNDFGKEVGLSFETINKELTTTLPFEGTIDQADELNDDKMWVKVRKTDSIEEIDSKEIEYFIPIEENGAFNKEINLPNGEGDYRITVRLPGKSGDKENTYYDAATLRVENLDENIAREVEYRLYALEKGLLLNEAITGWNQAKEIIEIEGTVDNDYTGTVILAEVKKDGEKNTVPIRIENNAFKGEIPLYYGKGTHEIELQLTYEEEEGEGRDRSYIDAARFFVHNDSDKIFPEITQYGTYLDSGINLETPSWNMEKIQDTIDYPIKGTIDENAPLADAVSHVIVVIQHENDREEEATYYFPVVNNRFEGTAHFRFGPGEYDVTIHVPKHEQKKKSEFHFTPTLAIKHEVVGIDDERDSLPSRGVESEDLDIKEKAKSLTKGLDSEREKAKAIYEFVAKHVAYDVEKFRDDIFDPDDSALKTLESGKGICQDYAFLTIALLRSTDIESRYVRGHAGGRHAWVEAKVDGEWIEMDPTWGAGIVDRKEFEFKYNEDYFDPDPAFLGETHRRQGLLY